MKKLDKLIENQIERRFEQMHTFGSKVKDLYSTKKKIEKDVKENPETDIESRLIEYKKTNLQITLLEESMNSVFLRIVELYTIAKLGEVSLNIKQEDIEHLESVMSSGSIDLFGVKNNELIILDKNFHNIVMERTKELKEGDKESILNFILKS